MGIFDRVWADCDCGSRLEFQSKGSEDRWQRDFDIDDVPADVASDCTDTWCEACGAAWEVDRPSRVALRIRKIDGGERAGARPGASEGDVPDALHQDAGSTPAPASIHFKAAQHAQDKS